MSKQTSTRNIGRSALEKALIKQAALHAGKSVWILKASSVKTDKKAPFRHEKVKMVRPPRFEINYGITRLSADESYSSAVARHEQRNRAAKA